jgi:hypothetical protein
MANPTATLRQVLHGMAPDDVLKVMGQTWRAEALLNYLVARNDARLSENCIEASDGTFTLYAAGMGAVDSTTPSMKATVHTRKTS